MFEAMLPPPEFDYPYPGTLNVVLVQDMNEMQRKCDYAGKPKYTVTLACASRHNTNPISCTIHWPAYSHLFPEKYMAYLWRHEVAHCNGWMHP